MLPTRSRERKSTRCAPSAVDVERAGVRRPRAVVEAVLRAGGAGALAVAAHERDADGAGVRRPRRGAVDQHARSCGGVRVDPDRQRCAPSRRCRRRPSDRNPTTCAPASSTVNGVAVRRPRRRRRARYSRAADARARAVARRERDRDRAVVPAVGAERGLRVQPRRGRRCVPASTLSVTDLKPSALPAPSIARYSSVCSPSSSNANGPAVGLRRRRRRPGTASARRPSRPPRRSRRASPATAPAYQPVAAVRRRRARARAS